MVVTKKLKDNPISQIIKEVKRAIKNSNLDEGLKKQLLPNNEITHRIYGAPKIHKNDTPLRPILNTIGLPTYGLANYVAESLTPFVGKSDSYIKDSSHYVDLIKGKRLDLEEKIVSFDVTQLFTKIPLEEDG